jgi:hypothetical protein
LFTGKVKDNLNNMLLASTRQAYEDAFSIVRAELQTKPGKLEYLEGFYNKPERIARYWLLDNIRGNLGKVSSSHAEQNNASIVAELGIGASWDTHEHIKNLMNQQKRLETSRSKLQMDDALLSAMYSSDLVDAPQHVKDDDTAARNKLSCYAFHNIWRKILQDSKYLDCRESSNGGYEIWRIGEDWSSEKTVHLYVVNHCCCHFSSEYDVQCVHEYLRDQRQLRLDLYDTRWYKEMCVPVALGTASTASNIPVVGLETDNFDDVPFDQDDASMGNVVESIDGVPAGECFTAGDEDSDSVSTRSNQGIQGDESVSLMQVSSPSAVAAATATAHSAVAATVPRKMLRQQFDDLEKAVGKDSKRLALLSGALFYMTNVFRVGAGGTLVTDIREVLDKFEGQYGRKRRAEYLSSDIPVAATANHPGSKARKRLKPVHEKWSQPITGKGNPTCGFCSMTGHNISSCTSRREYGSFMTEEEQMKLVGNLSGNQTEYAIFDRATEDQCPVLTEMRRRIKFVVLYRFLRICKNGGNVEGNLCIEATCLDKDLRVEDGAKALYKLGVMRLCVATKKKCMNNLV